MSAPVQRLLHDDPAHAFNGWLRADLGVWLVACSAASQGACWDALLRVPTEAQHTERCVLPANQRPDKKRRR